MILLRIYHGMKIWWLFKRIAENSSLASSFSGWIWNFVNPGDFCSLSEMISSYFAMVKTPLSRNGPFGKYLRPALSCHYPKATGAHWKDTSQIDWAAWDKNPLESPGHFHDPTFCWAVHFQIDLRTKGFISKAHLVTCAEIWPSSSQNSSYSCNYDI